MKKRPNILFLFADDMRYDTIRALGNPDIRTPHLDALVHGGVSFTNAHIPGGTCGAVCMPSRAMLHTGRTLFHIADHGADIPPEHATMGETLARAGFRTFGTGKWHNGPRSYARSFQSGAEIFFGGMYDHWKVPAYDYDDTGEYAKIVCDIANPFGDNRMGTQRMDHVTWGKHSTDLFADAACAFLDGYAGDQPFFMYVSYMAPHDPRTMPQAYLDLYDVDAIALPENAWPEHPFDYGVRGIRDELLESYPRRPDAIRRHMRDYYAMVTHLDASVGRILDSLKRSGQYDDTIIVFSADNGLGLGQHGLMGKQSCYEHSIRVPLIVSGPGIPKDERRDALVYLLDIFPTLCERSGIEVPHSVEGRSFAKLLTDGEARTRDALFFAYEDRIRGIKDERYKLIVYRFGAGRWMQLFDLREDPWETNDLAGDPGYARRVADMHAEMVAVSDAWGDRESDVGDRFWRHPMRIKAH